MRREEFETRVADWGLRRTCYWYLMTFLGRVFGLHLHYVYISGLPGRVPTAVAEGYEHREVPLAELMPYADGDDELGRELGREFLLQAMDRGDRCVASFFGAEPVGLDFASSKRLPATSQLDHIIPTGFLYSYKSWTHTAHRGKKLALGRIDVQWKQGLNFIYAIETHNYPSVLRPYRPPSERRIQMGYAGWIEIRGRQHPFVSRRAKWIGFGLVPTGGADKRRYVEG